MLGALVAGMARGRARPGWRGKCRRLFLLTFRLRYVRQQLNQRQGTCNQCGACCRLVVVCPFLTDNRCSIYGDCRPTVCRVFPIDRRDLTEVADQCSYTFSAEPAPLLLPLASFVPSRIATPLTSQKAPEFWGL